MSVVFADTSYYVALTNSRDEHHRAACELTREFAGAFVTTAWVVTELGNYFFAAANRSLFLALLAELRNDRRVAIVPASQELLDRGVGLYSQRLDKNWSLTDCVSFVVMQDRKMVNALTADHHFEQAGFNVLFK